MRGPEADPPIDMFVYCWPVATPIRSVHCSCGEMKLPLRRRVTKFDPDRVRTCS